MHGLIRERLEQYLRGTPGTPETEAHLRACAECREQLSWMQDHSQMLHLLAPPESMDPAPGFYARVLERIEARQTASVWNAFLEPAFGRWIVAGSLALAGLMVAFLATTGNRAAALNLSNPEVIMAVEQHPPGLGTNVQRDRETVLVSLASYRE
jgi:predicted anti-sigma-YlaC factor YlaD